MAYLVNGAFADTGDPDGAASSGLALGDAARLPIAAAFHMGNEPVRVFTTLNPGAGRASGYRDGAALLRERDVVRCPNLAGNRHHRPR
jgi:hypothetical protein